MDTFIDYYAILGVKEDTSTQDIKAAFKKLALQYHPDVYKGEDAQERMRLLLLAYQILRDPATRKTYDAQRSEHMLGVSVPRRYVYRESARAKKPDSDAEVSPSARRDRQRSYAFPDLQGEIAAPVRIDLGDMTYELSPSEARTLKLQGMLRGLAPEARGDTGASIAARNKYPHHCHRCHHSWTLATLPPRSRTDICPACKARDWAEYLLLRCIHCHAVFESEQIRYEIGSYNYGDGTLCPPYELFPLCPYCGASGWCPAEDARVDALRIQAARRAALLRIVWISCVVLIAILLSVLVMNVVR